jgi:hypothetical protein
LPNSLSKTEEVSDFPLDVIVIVFLRRRRLGLWLIAGRWTWLWGSRWGRWDFTGRAQRNDLLLDARLISERHALEALRQTSLIGCIDATLDTSSETIDPLLKRGPEQCGRVKFNVLIRLTLELEQNTERIFNVVQAEAEPHGDPALHQHLGGGVRRPT